MVGISRDPVESHLRFHESLSLSFPLVSDPEGRIAALYDVRRRMGLGTSRVTYLIDKNGIIRRIFHHELRIKRHLRDVIKGLAALESGPYR